MIYIVNGCAGFIGWKICEFLLRHPELVPGFNSGVASARRPMLDDLRVVGIDNMNDYYDVRLKE